MHIHTVWNTAKYTQTDERRVQKRVGASIPGVFSLCSKCRAWRWTTAEPQPTCGGMGGRRTHFLYRSRRDTHKHTGPDGTHTTPGQHCCGDIYVKRWFEVDGQICKSCFPQYFARQLHNPINVVTTVQLFIVGCVCTMTVCSFGLYYFSNYSFLWSLK